ncbi:MAG: diguanylate cyclase, partial [Actinomycetota bacterium]|nr:diguanylate cyclase [Actinomycetota bacterium]
LLDCPPAAGELVTARLRDRVEAHNLSAGRPYRLSVSIGIAYWQPGDAPNVESLIEQADRSMYLDKAGRT